MPRFLNTFTGEFEWREDPRQVAYAILSHTWSLVHPEQSYEEVLRLQAKAKEAMRRYPHKIYVEVVREVAHLRIKRPSQMARIYRYSMTSASSAMPYPSVLSLPDLSYKIKGACEVARKAGYRLLWIDSCCINKSSSAELTEAINSMYELYRLADICYVYLEDVPDAITPESSSSSFRRSRWHKRGWTLQELIAPERVVFLTRTWRFIGTKMGLASTLEKVTGVDFDILTGRTTVDRVSIARRMSWAAGRETTRVEDRAYALLGIFGVHISPIYGEGTNAFLRLQEEIIKTIPDQSIFAWGNAFSLTALTLGSYSITPGVGSTPGLLADSPDDFARSWGIYPLSPADFSRRLRRQWDDTPPPVHCVFTPHGVRIQLLCIDFARLPQVLGTLSWSMSYHDCYGRMRLGDPYALAFLQCADDDGALVALPLFRAQTGSGDHLGLMIATHPQCGNPNHFSLRTLRLRRPALEEVLQLPSAVSAREVSLLRHYLEPPLAKGHQPHFSQAPGIDLWPTLSGRAAYNVVFHVAPGCLEELNALGFELRPLLVGRSDQEILVTTSLAYDPASHHENGSRTDAAGQQIVELEIALILARPWSDTDTLVRFSVSNSISMISPGPAPRVEGEPLPADSIWPNGPPPRILKGALAEGNIPHDRSPLFTSTRTTTRTLGEARFIVAADTDWTANTFNLRVVRLKVERSLGSHFGVDRTNLWLHIEVSEKYRHKAKIVEDDWAPAYETHTSEHRLTDPSAVHTEEDELSAALSTNTSLKQQLPGITSRSLARSLQIPRSQERFLGFRGNGVHGFLASRPSSAPPTLGAHLQDDGSPVDNGARKGSRSVPSGSRYDLSSNDHMDQRTNTPKPESTTVTPDHPPHLGPPAASLQEFPSSGDGPDTMYASKRSLDMLQRENEALRAQTVALASQVSAMAAQNAALSSQNDELSAQVNAMSAQIASILSRLDAPSACA